MAITFLEKRKRLEYLIHVLVVLLFITVFVLWQGFFSPHTTPYYIIDIDTFEEAPRRIEIDFQALKDPFLDTLLPFEEIAPWEEREEGLGRENPFLPYRLREPIIEQ